MTETTNPLPDFDINATADRVIELLRANQMLDAMRALQQARENQPAVVQEALDRFIVARAPQHLDASVLSPTDSQAIGPALDRIRNATAAPRFVAESETENLTVAQRFDVYASIIETRGNQAARDSLADNERVILGLRNENSTLASPVPDNPATPQNESHNGQGIYNDRLVVLRRDADGTRHVDEFSRANTEPTAQYDYRAGHDGRGGQAPRAAAEGFEQVRERYNSNNTRKVEGEDINNDAIPDMGRLAEGTIEMRSATHANPGTNDFSLRPSDDAIAAANRANRVERDSNGDGWFNQHDVNGLQDLNRTFKIHEGSRTNTDSAGCQTIHRDDYSRFVGAVAGADTQSNHNLAPVQSNWQYVLTSTTNGNTQAIDVPLELPMNQGALPNDILMPPRPLQFDPTRPGHPDFLLHRQIEGLVHQLDTQHGRAPDANSERMAMSLLAVAKQQNITHPDNLILSQAGQSVAAGENLILVQGRLDDPAHQRAAINTALAANTPIEKSLERIGNAETAALAQTNQTSRIEEQEQQNTSRRAMA